MGLISDLLRKTTAPLTPPPPPPPPAHDQVPEAQASAHVAGDSVTGVSGGRQSRLNIDSLGGAPASADNGNGDSLGGFASKIGGMLSKERTTNTAVAQAEALWTTPENSGEAYRSVNTSAIADTENGEHFQGLSDDDISQNKAKAALQVDENQSLESDKLATLPPDQQAAYKRVEDQTSSDPEAHLALQVLLLQGKLPGPSSSKDGKNLLQTLDGVSQQQLDPKIDRGQLVGQLVRECADPTVIRQNNKGTCTVTSVQVQMATENPAEYARIVGGLASPDGKVKLANGDTIHRLDGTDQEDGSARSIPGRLWQPAMMEYASGNTGGFLGIGSHKNHYHNDTDKFDDGTSGLNNDQVDKVVDALTNGKGHEIDGHHDQTLGAIQAATDHGKPVVVAVNWGQADATGKIHEGHEIEVTQIKDGRVYYNNPWGTQESMSVADFNKRVKGAEFSDMSHLG